jgi:transcriptional regulator with XRE-family HTH domain
MEDSFEIGRVFREQMALIRERHGLSQAELARRVENLGIRPFTQTTVAKIERLDHASETKARKVTLEEAIAIAYALDVAPLYLFLPLHDEVVVAVTPERAAPAWVAREWFIGGAAAEGQDEGFYIGTAPPSELETREWQRRMARTLLNKGELKLQDIARDPGRASVKEWGRVLRNSGEEEN